MKQIEADLIAKAIRNCRSSLEDKKDITDTICREILYRDQFFNTKRFRNLAIHTLPEGWPDRMENGSGN
jgi:hypothetical protein